MNLVLVPIPLDCLEGSAAYWRPYIAAISKRDGCDVAEKERMLFAGEVQAFLVWEPEIQKAFAFIGVQFVARGQQREGRAIWLMGENRRAWAHLLGELETYLRDHQQCVAMEPVCRPGWSKLLKAQGYHITHLVMRKELS